MDNPFAIAQAALNSQPFSALLGTRLSVFAPGQAELQLAIRPDLLQQHGYVHGGVLSYLADNALTFAGGSVLGPNVLTGSYTITYLRPARGERLIARALVVSSGRSQAVCRCDVFSVSGTEELLCAAAQGTIVVMRD
jgi:uncharacterized protein (TIGR00369 family)